MFNLDPRFVKIEIKEERMCRIGQYTAYKVKATHALNDISVETGFGEIKRAVIKEALKKLSEEVFIYSVLNNKYNKGEA